MKFENYKNAIFYLKRIISLNYNYLFLDLIYLYNIIVICYLKIEDINHFVYIYIIFKNIKIWKLYDY